MEERPMEKYDAAYVAMHILRSKLIISALHNFDPPVARGFAKSLLAIITDPDARDKVRIETGKLLLLMVKEDI